MTTQGIFFPLSSETLERERVLPDYTCKHYGFLESLIPCMSQIRIFPDLNKTLDYARMLERAGACLVAVHGRTREQKDASQVKADWDAIKVGLFAFAGKPMTIGSVKHDQPSILEAL